MPDNLLHGSDAATVAMALSQSDKQLVCIDYFAAWCPHCPGFASYFKDLARRFPEVLFVTAVCQTSSGQKTEAYTYLVKQVNLEGAPECWPTFKLVYAKRVRLKVEGGGGQAHRELADGIRRLLAAISTLPSSAATSRAPSGDSAGSVTYLDADGDEIRWFLDSSVTGAPSLYTKLSTHTTIDTTLRKAVHVKRLTFIEVRSFLRNAEQRHHLAGANMNTCCRTSCRICRSAGAGIFWVIFRCTSFTTIIRKYLSSPGEGSVAAVVVSCGGC